MKIRYLGSLGLIFALNGLSMEEQKKESEGPNDQPMSTDNQIGLLDQCSRRGEVLLNKMEARTESLGKSMEAKTEMFCKNIERFVLAALGGPSVGLDLLKNEIRKLAAEMRGARDSAARHFRARRDSLSKLVEQNWELLERNLGDDWKWIWSVTSNGEKETALESNDKDNQATSEQENNVKNPTGESSGQ